ncbi:MAG: host attachment protein [Pseudomonadota bacterium]
MKTWVVVADAARARFFKLDEVSKKLLELMDLSHPESAMHASEMASDAPGMSSVKNMESKFGMDEIVPPKEEEAIRFAKQVADAMLKDVAEYDRLYLIAAPHFLGLLRKDMDKNVTAKLAAEIDKDLSKHIAEDIRAHLPEHL